MKIRLNLWRSFFKIKIFVRVSVLRQYAGVIQKNSRHIAMTYRTHLPKESQVEKKNQVLSNNEKRL